MSSNKEEEQQFTIQPHPETSHTNTKSGSAAQGGQASATEAAIQSNPGLAKLPDEIASKIETPKGKEELAKISAELNKDS
ncbi:hypothetical protein FA10DRAFT_287334 [Acaromyces ingoldii]|uniref:Uncharacterized protein n=1 Tax=Acaromyces ingoldii TaxID=215250 RepID=A0A316YJ66_9BASI|nr:hypothetical protein FA10DRAFT_287334 [Acaromyces ingoldii]PWN89467.1 hypothetical protein FA10DRAFT_287334 [Acaromyces ingoldii]